MSANVWLSRVFGAVSLAGAVAVSLWGIACGSSGGSPQDAGKGDVQITFPDGGSQDSGDSGAPIPFESGATEDTGTGGGTCPTPGSTSALVPSFNPLPKGACSLEQIQNIVNECFGGDPDASTTACANLIQGSTAYDNCVTGCLFTDWTRANWGAMVALTNPGESDFFNVGGCFVATDPSLSKCATDLQEQLECELFACQASCPVPKIPTGENPSTDTAYLSASDLFSECQMTADISVCKKYVTAVGSDCPTTDAGLPGALTNCLNDLNIIQTTMSQSAYAAANLDLFTTLCVGLSDGGTPDTGAITSDAGDGG